MIRLAMLKRPADPKVLLNQHILNSSATLVGVCMTVISLVKLIEHQTHVNSVLDEVMSVDAVGFVAAAMLSYLSMRAGGLREGMALKLEQVADVLFMISLVGMAVTGVLFAFEFI